MVHNVMVETRPRKIVWIVKIDDWDSLFQIVKYNCWIMGGYYNIIISVDANWSINKNNKETIISYDPDLVILTQGMKKENFDVKGINPYDIVEWEYLEEYIDYYDGGISSCECIRVNKELIEEQEPCLKDEKVLVLPSYILNDTYDKFAYLICGDVFSYGHIDEDELSYREQFLIDAVKDELYYGNFNKFNRQKFLESYEDSINEINKFPINDMILSLKKNIQIQFRFPSIRTFINTTKSYMKIRAGLNEHRKNINIIMSNNFSFREALMFWNLRANGEYVHWIQEDILMDNINEFIVALNDLISDSYFETYHKTISFVVDDLTNYDIDIIYAAFKKHEINVSFKYYSDFTTFNYELPYIEEKHSIIINNGKTYETIVDNPNQHASCILKIKSNDFTYPSNKIIDRLLSEENYYYYKDNHRIINRVYLLRVSKDKYINIQYSGGRQSIIFNDINVNECFNAVFNEGGYSNLELSSTGRYHQKFIELSGGFSWAIKYITRSPYKGILSLLKNNTSKKEPGWILKNIERRVLNIFELFKFCQIDEPNNYKELYDKCDLIPKEILELQEKSILQRGFNLTCKYCNFENWCYVEEVGQKFRCKRCNEEQTYDINPLWLYKLNEVVYQGLVSDMEVPLLTVNYLQKISKRRFQWIIDSDITQQKTLKNNNLDIICIIDGKMCVGEVKSCDYIDKEQFHFYEQLCQSVEVDCIVFATLCEDWCTQTKTLIEQLNFKGEKLVLTKKELI